MEENLKKRIDVWYRGCRAFEMFDNQLSAMIHEMRPEEICKFRQYEEFEAKHSRSGRSGYRKYIKFEIDDFSRYDPSIKLIVLKNNTRYELQIIDRDLNYITERVYGLKQNQIDGDYVALITIDNGHLENHRMCELDIMKTEEGYNLVCREWANLQIVNTQTKPLHEQEIKRLLSKDDIKQF